MTDACAAMPVLWRHFQVAPSHVCRHPETIARQNIGSLLTCSPACIHNSGMPPDV